MQELGDKIKAQEYNFRQSTPAQAALPGGQLLSPDAVNAYRHVMKQDPDLTLGGVQPGAQQPGVGVSGSGVSLKEAMNLPAYQGKSEDEVRKAIVDAGHSVLP